MSNRDWELLLEDIVESADKIFIYTNKLSFDEFSTNSLVIDAVVRNLEIIGEASKNVPVDIQEKFSDVPWRKLKGIRNRIVHEYFRIDVTIIWFIIQNELMPLKDVLIKHLSGN